MVRLLSSLPRIALAGVVGIAAACATSRPASASSPDRALQYRLSIPQPHRQWVHVEIDVRGVRGDHLDAAIPAWSPGSYLIRDFGRHVFDVTARDAKGRVLAVEQRDKQTWRIAHRGRDFTLSYRVFADELSVRTSHVDHDSAHLNGSTLLMYLPAHRDVPTRLEVELPTGWNAHTALPRIGQAQRSISFSARDYDALVDAPLQLGNPQSQTFEHGGTRFEYVLDGGPAVGADLDRLVADAKRVVSAFDRVMGGFPMTRYVFLASVTGDGGGGLEHANSTMMMMRRDSFASGRGYYRAARMAGHEFFHLWNVKRIRDAALIPYDYAAENHTRLLWFHEGFTETIEGLVMVRAGIETPKDFVRHLGRRWTRYLRRPGRNAQPIGVVSFNAWTRFYKKAANQRNVTVSYYEKGDFLGIALDLEIRRRAAKRGKTGDLFGVFRRLMKSHGSKGRGITQADIIVAATAEAGEDMAWFFEQYVDGTRDVPLPELLREFGVEVEQRSPKKDSVWSGITWSGNGIGNLAPDSPATRAGLMRDDEVVAIDGHEVTSADQAQTMLRRAGAGATVQVHVFRDATLRKHSLALAPSPYPKLEFKLAADETLTSQARALRDAWLETF